ncbi:MAG: fibronectin type III domain-containing protein [Bacteroidetes bacterium]|nr:fibronectin type III domain-containing protein [Bacteroidota bacterium]
MKKQLLLVFSALFMVLSTFAGTGHRNCGTMENLDRLKMEDPGLESRMQQLEQQTSALIAARNGNGSNATDVVITIPVVFHIVYSSSTQNISDAQCIAQLNQLNLDYARLNSDAGNTPATWQGISANTNVQFCLAQRTPAGAATTGIERRSITSPTSFSTNDNVKRFANGGLDAWSSSSYLNIWVCNLSGGVLGYAQFPGGSASTDGVVLTYYCVGSIASPGPSSGSPYNLGRTATHEVGHWLNLYHIWGDDGTSCSGTDNVSDTPNQAGENYGAPAFPRTDACSPSSPGVMFMNYMDYTDDNAMNMFTNGQSSRMTSLLGTGGSRGSLASSLGCQAPSTTCNVPTGMSTASITSSSATLNWTAVSAATSYNVQYRIVGAANWTATTSATNSKALTGLTASSNYEWQVATVCASGSSAFTASTNFSTSAVATCNVPTGMSTASITSSSATLNWTAVSGATSYNVRYRIVGAANWTSTTSATNSKALTGLTASSNYEWQVATVCASGSSAFTASTNFSTSAVATCNVPTGMSTASITSSSATLNWTAVSGATSYNVRYRIVGAANWTSTTSTTNSKAISALTASSNYEWQVSTVCASGSSAYTASTLFTTLAAATCGTPTGQVTSAINSTGATLGWTAVSGATSYNVRYRIVGAANWTSTTSATNTKAIAGLTASSNYEWQVQAVCASGTGAFTASATFTTSAPSGCSDVYESNNTSGTAKTISTNTDIVALIGTTTDSDWFKFTTTSPNTYIKLTLTNLPFDYDVRLYNSNVSQLSISQLGGTSSEQIIRNTTTASTYYVRVYGYNSAYSTTACYTLRISVGSTAFRTVEDIVSEPVAETAINDFNLFPNPAKDEVNVTFNSMQNESLQIRVFDMVGKTIREERVDVISGYNKFNLDLTLLNKGIYFVELTNSSERVVKKLILEK